MAFFFYDLPMDKRLYDQFINILKEELVPAMGCTEPISVAYATAKAKEYLDGKATSAVLSVSPNILKNVKSVTVPHTGGLIGLKAAVLVGLVSGDASLELSVLSNAKKEDEATIHEMMGSFPLKIEVSEDEYVFDIAVRLENEHSNSYVRIVDDHTKIISIKKNDVEIYSQEIEKKIVVDKTLLTIENIVEFANTLNVEDVAPTLNRQVEYNLAIATEGINNKYGANIGKIYLSAGDPTPERKAKAYAAAGSDARMNGCEMPVIINSGSGNQGLTCSVPVIVYAKENNRSNEDMLRALAVSNLVTIHLKTGIGTLSAYCGVVSAGAGAVAGISYLEGKSYQEIAHVIINCLAIDSGIICDGAKASCAAKIMASLETGFLGIRMQESNNNFYTGCGIVKENVEETIRSVNRLASKGMRDTDKEIIKIMLENE